jgi:K+-transporting ATPase ATPase C chain
MLVHLRRSVTMALIWLVLLGFVYALVGTGVAQVLFKYQADGSIGSLGSPLIGQNWSQTKCPGHPLGSCVFQGRPDNVGPYAASFKPVSSGGDNPLEANNIPGHPRVRNPGESAASNLGPRSKVLLENTEALVVYWHKLGVDPTPDLVTTSGSGYDPDITPADATAEIPMVSRATGLSPSTLKNLIKQQTHGEEIGFLGSQYIVVLQLNEALARLR